MKATLPCGLQVTLVNGGNGYTDVVVAGMVIASGTDVTEALKRAERTVNAWKLALSEEDYRNQTGQ